jgi:hypothetical protein
MACVIPFSRSTRLCAARGRAVSFAGLIDRSGQQVINEDNFRRTTACRSLSTRWTIASVCARSSIFLHRRETWLFDTEAPPFSNRRMWVLGRQQVSMHFVRETINAFGQLFGGFRKSRILLQ